MRNYGIGDVKTFDTNILLNHIQLLKGVKRNIGFRYIGTTVIMILPDDL